ncbi:1,3-beta-glucan synthase component-domain containing protein [Nitzschia inconspicua]|uniref:1,3-beta-glucan synthase n=1 Tax=Nitzschia inconspicua TaxID=303405 RepID=A0A9K3Q0G1_9STRA|nr:1,3-beta-glucan synthase component-domain containing protein [Nitzschia inconspicua]
MSSAAGFAGSGDSVIMETVSTILYPAIRLVVAGLSVWLSAGGSKDTRYFSGILSGLLAGFVTYVFLEPLFVPVGLDFAMVILYILSFLSALVGMSLGVLLPTLFPGICCGVNIALLLGTFLGNVWTLYFPVVGGALALVGAFLSVRWNATYLTTCTTILQIGAIAASLVLKSILGYIMDVARGYPFYPNNSHHDDFDIPIPDGVLYGLVWAAGSCLVAAAIVFRDGDFERLKLPSISLRNGYSAVPQGENGFERDRSNKKVAMAYRDSPPVPEAFNMFDPADLPPRLAEYANMVYSACEDLGNFFGFQDSSVRNQAEHLLILLSNNRRYMSSHILPPSVQPPSPIHALHAKVFSNYVKWCRAMGVPPHFSKMNTSMSAPPAVASRVVDLVLYFCIWGEGCNLRHMPECVWFLYHKMMEEYIKSEGYTQTRSLYAGHFLDNVVEPIYSILNTSMKSNADHSDKRNYDDFNEFFWSRDCLKYHYSIEDSSSHYDIEGNGMIGALPGESLSPVSDGLNAAPKTFLEKRSWLRGMLALNRILEWHIVTFYLLAVVAFARELVWGWVYSVQVASGVFWIFNFLFLFWQLLEVWGSYPGIQLSATEVCGSVLILVARFLTLTYQSLYLVWAFSPQQGTYLGIEGDSTFWWWQYIWLSLLVMIPYVLETIPQLYPPLATTILTSQSDYVQSFLNILYPSSRLYVGKEVHESFGHTIVYLIFWSTLMLWKLLFSYVFEVYSMVLPSIQLTDDYVNYPNQSFAKMMLLLVMRWLPQFIVYLIDMSIWYAAWQAFAGTAVGFSDNLGDIRSLDDIRNNFGRAPELFCKKMLSPDAGSRRGSSASFLGNSQGSLQGESSSLLGSNPQRLQSYVNRLLDVRIQKWVMFSAAWNEIIDHLREEDVISNAESDNLKFSQFDGFSQAIYLPVFQTAGAIEDVLSELERPIDDYADSKTGKITDESYFKPISEHVTMQTAVSEVWELGAFLIKQTLGPLHSADVNAIGGTVQSWAEDGCLSAKMELRKARGALQNLVDAIKILEKGIKKRKPAPKPRSQFKKSESNKQGPVGGIHRSASVGTLGSLEMDATGFQKYADGFINPDVPPEIIIDAMRDQVRDKLRSFMHAIKGLLKCSSNDPESRDVLDRLTFLGSMENGFFWDDAYASDMLDDVSQNANFKAVLKKLYGLLCMHPDDVEPKSKEVIRRLTFFTNSLFMDMPDAPSIHDMFSWNVMTPYYSEDVTYSKGDLESRSDALGVSTMLYLQTLYRDQWSNFLERTGIQDEEKMWSKKYVEETRRWASIRAQTLSRTVNGMMYYEKALRLLANMERLDDDTTNDLVGEKFGYVVSCQVYGNMKRNQDPKADDIEALMHRFPHLRVAYIDNIRLNRDGAAVFYSVLVKSDGRGNIVEVYRVRLPGDPVIGEGKPENQNHAMIFTRGEFLQTIDMNQEGYFEEALKMRNCLQEFAKREGPLPTTILGLREHIFTGSVSSLANYMALQEISFVTLGQRVLTRPLHIRLHYGHPDIFDKLFAMTRGGVSKASKGINLSEDIFAGYNNVLRGGSVGFKEYLQVGKGRDVGMSQIYKFEAKLSQGAAEQSLSRDVYRMCHRLDFCRLLSFYYGGIGHYFSNVLTVLTVYVVVYLMAVLAIFQLEKIGDRLITPMGTIQMLLGGLGLLQTIPLFATLGVERGWLASIQEIFMVFATGGPLHFMFHIQTKANYMTQTILVGGAKYRPTGRGFVTQHTPMDEQFRFFAASHLYLGVELAAGLLVMGIYTDAGQYFGRTWSLWLASISFLASPFWFNPLTFEWNVVTADYALWIRWMRGTSGGAAKSWSMWYNEENAFYKKLMFSSKFLFLVKAALLFLVADGIWKSDLFRSDASLSNPAIRVTNLLIILCCLLVLAWVVSAKGQHMAYPVRRTIGILVAVGLMAAVVMLFIEDSNYLRYALAGYYGMGAICMVGLLYGFKFVKVFYCIHDIVCAHIIFIPLFVMAALQLPGQIQTWLLYHNALSTNVVVSDILRYARKTQESGGSGGGEANEDLMNQVNELKKIVHRQEKMLESLGIATPREGSPHTAPIPIEQNLVEPTVLPGSSRPGYGRAVSMSGMDVWGEMALGDVSEMKDQGPSIAAPTSQPIQHSSATGFSFSQPDVMPPR